LAYRTVQLLIFATPLAIRQLADKEEEKQMKTKVNFTDPRNAEKYCDILNAILKENVEIYQK